MMIFIVGNSRSGTTMLGRILGKHTNIHTFGELHFFENLVSGDAVINQDEMDKDSAVAIIERLLTSSRDGFFAHVDVGKYCNEANEIFYASSQKDPGSIYRTFLHYETKRNGKCIPCEQTPRYLFSLKEIFLLYPDARVINMIRDPRDILVSQRNKWKRRFLGAKNIPLSEAFRSWSNYHPFLIAKLWASCIHQADAFDRHPNVISLKFEQLLAQPESSIRDVCNFLSIEFEPAMLQIPQIGSSSGTDKPDSLGVDSTRAQSWQAGGLSRSEQKICEWVSGHEMLNHGYSLSGKPHFSFLFLPSLFYLIFKLLFAVPMNISRNKNFIETIKRRLFSGK